MKGSSILLTLSIVLAVAAIMSSLHLHTLNRKLEIHREDLARTHDDITSRRLGCRKAIEDMNMFEKHLDSYLKERENEANDLNKQINAIRNRIGNIEKIKTEYEKLESELAEVNRILSTITGNTKEGR